MHGPLHVRRAPPPAPTLVLAFEGWNDAGEAATSAARYLRDAACAEPLAELDPEEFFDFTVARPTVRRGPGGERELEWPTLRFAHGFLHPTLPVLVGVGVEPHLRWGRFMEGVVELTRLVKAERVALLGAFLADVLYSRPVRITGFASEPTLLERLAVEPSDYEGPTGIVGALGERLGREGLQVVSFWAGLPHYIDASPNPRGALALLETLARWLGVPVDDAPLRTSADDFEEKISALVASDPALAEYVRQLKRRDFAQ